jgi:Mg2+ and Co2+ transporter CorA
MSENEVFVRKKKIFKNVKYLFVIKKDFMKTRDKWGGRIDYVNKIIKRKQRLHLNVMDKVVGHTKEAYMISLKHRLYQFQQKTDKSLNHIVDRIDRLDTNMRDYKILFEGLRKKY